MAIQESGEMYLETILILSKTSDHVRAVDISETMGYSKPSVSRAVGILRNDGFIEIDLNGYIHLTDAGRQIAETIYGRHQVLTLSLQGLGVDGKTASEDACRIEHVISDVSMEAIRTYMLKRNAEQSSQEQKMQ